MTHLAINASFYIHWTTFYWLISVQERFDSKRYINDKLMHRFTCDETSSSMSILFFVCHARVCRIDTKEHHYQISFINISRDTIKETHDSLSSCAIIIDDNKYSRFCRIFAMKHVLESRTLLNKRRRKILKMIIL